jgi:hypothetical protein
MKRPLYHAALRKLDIWESYLLEHSGLPGPRANLELAQAVADEAPAERLLAYAAITPQQAPANSPLEFLAICGVIGLGRLLTDGRPDMLPRLRHLSADPRWRVREAVCLALQRLGERDMDRLIREMRDWAAGSPFEQRAAAAALCEPALLRNARHTRLVLTILDEMTASLHATERHGEGFRVLRNALGYCWSIAVAALPEVGKPLMERWCADADPDIRWIMRENLRKARLLRMDPQWVLDVRLKYRM